MTLSFELPKNKSNSIKVIGVGGGGSNAVEYMFNQRIEGVDFVICNTDEQALNNSPVPIKLVLGAKVTKGMGAGSNPEKGYEAAIESEDSIREVLSVNTKMVFITAGMGGGTGTGAAPVIARISKELGFLTVGIVTMPFDFEGEKRIKDARNGIKNLREYVDALIVINNNKLIKIYGDLGYRAGFAKADEVLATAAKGIAQVITHHYKRNIDLNDAKTVLANSGNAIMGSATASGEGRAKRVITEALHSPLLNDNRIKGAQGYYC
jgi:cell division protein FtsZ